MNTRCLPPEHPNILGSYLFSSSMKVICATDVGMCDRGLVRGAGASLAIQTIFQNGYLELFLLLKSIIFSFTYKLSKSSSSSSILQDSKVDIS